MDDLTTDDLREVLSVSRELSIAWKHWFINYDHLFVGILKTTCMAAAYAAGFSSELWESKIKASYPVDENHPADETLPLTLHAERVIRQAYRMAEISNEKQINSVHLLLSILSYENDVSMAFSRMGILFEDIAEIYYKKPIQAFAPKIYPLRKKRYTKLGLFFLPAASKTREIESLVQNAYDLFMYGRYDDCIGICKIGLSIAPDNEEFRAMQVNSYMRKRDFTAALAIVNDLIKKQPDNFSYRFNASYINDELGNYTESNTIIDGLLEENPENTDLLNNKGFSLLKQGKYAMAMPFFEKIIQIEPQLSYSWNNLGYAKHRLGNTQEGLSMINNSLEFDKGNSYAYKNKGIIFLDQGNNVEALKNFELALRFRYTEKYGDDVLKLIEKTR